MGTYAINNWLWDFGNDSTGSGSSVSMSYQRPGEFDVTLTITDEYGLNDTLIASSIIQVDTTFGDVDWNTAVQSFDASLILQDLVELIELDSLQMLIGDVSGDSSLSTLDATLILQYVVGLIDELPYTAGTQYMATGDLNMDNQGIDPGMQIEIPIHISNGSNIYGFTGTINYDHTILNYDTLLLSDYLEGYLMAFNELSPGEIKIAASGNNPDGETGVFATMVFYVTDAFTDETSISITDLTWNEGEMIELAAEMTIAYGLGIDGVTIPDVYALHQNYPNPFNPTTQIKYDLPEDAMVSITIYDIMGRSISSLVNSKQTAGYRSIQWNATNNFGESVSAGMYIYMIQAGEFRKVKKMVLLK
jgi:PKD repeat protein